MKPVIVATRDSSRANAICAAIGTATVTRIVTRPQDFVGHPAEWAAMVLDADFTESCGLDVLRDTLARSRLPVLMLTPAGNPAPAAEALRFGASSYVVRGADAEALVSRAIREILRRETGAYGPAPAQAASGSSAQHSLIADAAERLSRAGAALPSYPTVAARFRSAVRENTPLLEVARLIEHDAGMAAKVLHVANSPYYRIGRKVESVRLAITRLGIDTTGLILEFVADRALYVSGNARVRPILDRLAKHGVASAYAAQSIARRADPGVGDEAFLAGLFHDIGVLILVNACAELEPDAAAFTDPARLADTRAAIAEHHGRCGAQLLEAWDLPPRFRAAADADREDGFGADSDPVLAAVHLASRMAHAAGYSHIGVPEERALHETPAAIRLKLSPDQIHEAAEEMRTAMEGCRSLFS